MDNAASEGAGAELLGSAPVSDPPVAGDDSAPVVPPPLPAALVWAALVGAALVVGAEVVVGDVDDPAEHPARPSAAAPTNPIRIFERVLLMSRVPFVAQVHWSVPHGPANADHRTGVSIRQRDETRSTFHRNPLVPSTSPRSKRTGRSSWA